MTTEFGRFLSLYRNLCLDPRSKRGRLTQARLGELLGGELGTLGFTGAAVSEWERGTSHIHHTDRRLLAAIVKVLHGYGGLPSPTEANTLLQAGFYSPLEPEILAQIFGGAAEVCPPDAPASPPSRPLDSGAYLFILFLGEIVFHPSDRLRQLFNDAADGPPPRWPRFLLNLLGWPAHNWSSEQTWLTILWLAVWLLTWRLVLPLMAWPFAGRAEARQAILLYVGGALCLPLLIGVLTRTRGHPFWHGQKLDDAGRLRLYTHQGAMVGFHVGTSGLFALALIGYYFEVGPLPRWLEGVAATVPVVLAYAAARTVPLNLWRAYGDLRLQDGAIFFVFIFFGPVLGAFFYAYYPWLLAPARGIPLILGAVGLLALLMIRQRRRTNSTVIPAHVWAAVYGVVAVLYTGVTAGWLMAVWCGGLLYTLVFLLARQQLQATWQGLAAFFILAGLSLWLNGLDVWAGRGVLLAAVAVWWFWGRKRHLRLPAAFWAVLAALAATMVLWRDALLADWQAALVFSVATAAILIVGEQKWRGPAAGRNP